MQRLRRQTVGLQARNLDPQLTLASVLAKNEMFSLLVSSPSAVQLLLLLQQQPPPPTLLLLLLQLLSSCCC